ncbi:uncharacterized protein [Onthophagus taurus]|uniref:uncharacterized protein n=1 Tax=Onthophagus taurus TaxID=166361 RepID=UPI0039BECA3F
MYRATQSLSTSNGTWINFTLPVLLSVALAIRLKTKNKVKRIWCKRWLKDKKKFGIANLLRELQETEPTDYKNFLRMSSEQFQKHLTLVLPLIEKKDTVMRAAVTAEVRLAVTLRYLATGNSLEDLKFSTIISPQLLGKIIPETCDAIYKVLQKTYMKFPKCEEEWKQIALEFKQRWNFDTCVGAIDGKHINIVKPPNSGSIYYNYKGKFSIVLMAVVDAHINLLWCRQVPRDVYDLKPSVI